MLVLLHETAARGVSSDVYVASAHASFLGSGWFSALIRKMLVAESGAHQIWVFVAETPLILLQPLVQQYAEHTVLERARGRGGVRQLVVLEWFFACSFVVDRIVHILLAPLSMTIRRARARWKTGANSAPIRSSSIHQIQLYFRNVRSETSA